MTDHTIPIEGANGAVYDKNNWGTMCNHHHNQKTRAEQKYGCLYVSIPNDKGKMIPKRTDEGELIPIDGGVIKRIFD